MKTMMWALLAGVLMVASARAEEKLVAVAIAKGDAKHEVQMPEAWKQSKPSGAMRIIQVAIPKSGDDKEDGEMVVMMMAGNGGGVDANLKRWQGQFGGEESQKDKKTVKTAAGIEATIAAFEGTYTAMSPMGAKAEPKEGYKMLGAIITADEGTYFVKLTGPKKTLDDAAAAFSKMVESFK